MAKTLRINEASRIFPGYDNYPNISITGSLTGMKRNYGWDTKFVVKIGSYYYYLKSHPNARNFFGIVSNEERIAELKRHQVSSIRSGTNLRFNPKKGFYDSCYNSQSGN